MTQEQMCLALFESTIRVVSEAGLDKTTTKAISKGANLNEVYIYRLFEGKEDMLKKTFDMLDSELADKCMYHLPVMVKREMKFEDRCRLLFSGIWKFLVGNRERCICFVRYFYSPYFKKLSAEGHRSRFEPVVKAMMPAFKTDVNVWLLLNHLLNLLLDFALLVFDGQLADDEQTAELVFTLAYSSVKPYLANH